MPLTRRRGLEFWLACILTLVAFGLYVRGLTQRSLWLDESVTLARVESGWGEMWRNEMPVQGTIIPDSHPQLYFVTLKHWQGQAGATEFALKVLSPLAFVLCVPLAFALGSRMRVAWAGTALAQFTTFSPGYVWYAEEMRPYAFVAPLAAATLYLLARGFDQPSPRVAAGALAVMALGVATHYLFVAILVGAVGAFAGWAALNSLRHKNNVARVAAVALAAAVGVVGVVVLVWPPFGALMQTGLANLSQLPFRGDLPFFYLLSSGSVFGMTAGDFTGGWLSVAMLALAALGWLLPLRPTLVGRALSRPAVFFATLPFVFTLLGVTLLSPNSSAYRYVLFAAPVFWLLTTRALFAIGQAPAARTATPEALAPRSTFAFTLGAGVLSLQLFGVASTFTPSPSWQDDWRSMAAYIRENWRDGDTVVITDILSPDRVLAKYLGHTPASLTPVSRLADEPATALAALRQHFQRVWLVNTGGADPALLKNGLFARIRQNDKVTFGGRSNTLELRQYELAPTLVSAIPPSAIAAPVAAAQRTAGQPRIVAVELTPGSRDAAQPAVWMRLFWDANGAPTDELRDYSIAARIVANGRTWGATQSAARLDTLGQFDAGKLAPLDYRFALPVGLPDQPYELQLTLRKGAKNEPVSSVAFPTPGASWRIADRDDGLSSSPIWQPTGATLRRAEFEREFHPGDLVPVALTWQLRDGDRAGWKTSLTIEQPLLGTALADGALQAPLSDVRTWPAGQPVRDLLTARIPDWLTPGFYTLMLNRSLDTGPVERTTLGLIQVSDFPFNQLRDAPKREVNASVGEFDLLGYRLDENFERGSVLNFFTYWRARERPSRDGVIFLFVFGPDGKLVAQDDSPPDSRSTRTWRAGEPLKHLHRIVLPADAPPGDYKLFAGIYNRDDKERWDATQDAAPAKDRLVNLGALTLK